MPKAFDSWNVLPHRAWVEHAENLWSIEGSLPGMALLRRMTIARRSSGGLVIHNSIALEEELMRKLESLGPVELVVVPNGWHRLDCAQYERRFPKAQIVAPAGARKKVQEVVDVDLTYAEAPADEHVSFEHLDGVREAEGVMRVRSGDGITLVLNDVLFNVAHMSGMHGLVMRLIGSTGGAKVTRVARLALVKNKPALRAHLERLADEGPVRVVPGHGDVIEQDAAAVLRRVAAAL